MKQLPNMYFNDQGEQPTNIQLDESTNTVAFVLAGKHYLWSWADFIKAFPRIGDKRWECQFIQR